MRTLIIFRSEEHCETIAEKIAQCNRTFSIHKCFCCIHFFLLRTHLRGVSLFSRGGHYFGGEGHNFFPSCLGEGRNFFQGFLEEGHNFLKYFY